MTKIKMGQNAPDWKPLEAYTDTDEGREKIKQHREGAEKDPHSRMKELWKHTTGYLKLHKALYKSRKKAYMDKRAAATARINAGDKNALMPFRDPFVDNYEKAVILARQLEKKLYPGGANRTDFTYVVSSDIVPIYRPNQSMKELANSAFTRTVFPPHLNLISEATVKQGPNKGARIYLFDDPNKPTEEKRKNEMIIHPNGIVEVTSDGVGPDKMLPPFPDAPIRYYDNPPTDEKHRA